MSKNRKARVSLRSRGPVCNLYMRGPAKVTQKLLEALRHKLAHAALVYEKEDGYTVCVQFCSARPSDEDIWTAILAHHQTTNDPVERISDKYDLSALPERMVLLDFVLWEHELCGAG